MTLKYTHNYCGSKRENFGGRKRDKRRATEKEWNKIIYNRVRNEEENQSNNTINPITNIYTDTHECTAI